MEETWDEVSWQEDNELKEWYVEYSAQVNDEKNSSHVYLIWSRCSRRAKESTSRD